MIWQDDYVPGLKPVQRELPLVTDKPFTPVSFDLRNAYDSDVQQQGHTPIATLILRVRALIPKAPASSFSASASSSSQETAKTAA